MLERLRRLFDNRLGQVGVALAFCGVVSLAWKLFPHPVVPIAFAFIPYVILITFKNPFLLVLLFVLFSFFRLHEAFRFLNPLRIPSLLALGTLSSIAWNLAVGTMRPYITRELKIFLMFFAVITLGVPFATSRPDAIGYYTSTYIKIVIMVFAICWLATEIHHFKKLAFGVVAAGTAVAGVAISNKLAGIGLVEGTRVTIGRDIGSMLGDPNDLSLALCFPASFAVAMFTTQGNKWYLKLFGIVCFGFIVWGVLETQSRGGLLGIMAVVGTIAWQKVKNKFLLIGAGGVVGLVLKAAAGVSDRSSGGAAESGIDESAMGRLYAWEAAFYMAVQNPLGVGLNNFVPNYFFYSHHWDGMNHAVHSTWFGVLGETGYIGLAIFVTLVLTLIRTAIRTVKATRPENSKLYGYDPALHTAAQAALAGLLSFCASGTFLTMGFVWPIYILLTLTVVVSRYAENRVPIHAHLAPDGESRAARDADQNHHADDKERESPWRGPNDKPL